MSVLYNNDMKKTKTNPEVLAAETVPLYETKSNLVNWNLSHSYRPTAALLPLPDAALESLQKL